MTDAFDGFQIGDRVEMVNNLYCDDHLPCNGSTGTILAINDDTAVPRLGVCWDEANEDNFHTLGGLCEDGYGWWVPPTSCEVIEADYDVNPQCSDALFSMLGI